MLSTEIMLLGGKAHQAFQKGDVASGLAVLDEQAFAFAREMAAATPYEVAITLAGTAKILEAAGQFELAALKFADVAAYAEIREPGTTETAGDFADLATMLERIGDRDGALNAVLRSAAHLKLAGDWERRRAYYESWMARLEVPSEQRMSPPDPHSPAQRAARLNIEFQQALARWKALPWWQRLRTRKPEPPQGT